ncbi:RNA polymerase sigma factor [Sphingomonas oligophenolica]|uniref:RNA polymerase sigma factor n=1 Tax=Sphingomonas oligophenolica TaxID=301154 RepID=A0ABU9Y811_9SPHN
MSEFEEGLQAILPRLRRFAHGLTANRADADDLTQIVIERALRARAQWQEGTRLDAWLFRIMRNCWIDTVRSRARAGRVAVAEEAGRNVGHDPRPGMDAKIDLERAMRAMDQLPPEQREVVALVLIEGFGYREAAELLDLPIGTISSRLVRGRTALLALVGKG